MFQKELILIKQMHQKYDICHYWVLLFALNHENNCKKYGFQVEGFQYEPYFLQ